MHGTVRTFLPETRNEIPSKMLTVSEGVCTAMGASCELNYVNGYPATINSVTETDISAKAAIDLVGEDKLCAIRLRVWVLRIFRICFRLVRGAMLAGYRPRRG
ncbi:MAG: hypothetical protein Ct9H300mP28_34040 [Pseudomonadota bacterium]|nr:MAG: hypothetical protein Ct9H300mP28_34040 [Pseudomonadota bacterium]